MGVANTISHVNVISLPQIMRTRQCQFSRTLSHRNEFQFNSVALVLAESNMNLLEFGNSKPQSGSDITPENGVTTANVASAFGNARRARQSSVRDTPPRRELEFPKRDM